MPHRHLLSDKDLESYCAEAGKILEADALFIYLADIEGSNAFTLAAQSDHAGEMIPVSPIIRILSLIHI